MLVVFNKTMVRSRFNNRPEYILVAITRNLNSRPSSSNFIDDVGEAVSLISTSLPFRNWSFLLLAITIVRWSEEKERSHRLMRMRSSKRNKPTNANEYMQTLHSSNVLLRFALEIIRFNCSIVNGCFLLVCDVPRILLAPSRTKLTILLSVGDGTPVIGRAHFKA